MSNTMTAAAAHEPIHYLDSILNEEEKRCEYSHQWRNFTISRSGRFRSKNKKRDVVDGKLFDAVANANAKENEKISARNGSSKCYQNAASNSSNTTTTTAAIATSSSTSTGTSMRSQRDKTESYKSFYETNL